MSSITIETGSNVQTKALFDDLIVPADGAAVLLHGKPKGAARVQIALSSSFLRAPATRRAELALVMSLPERRLAPWRVR